MQKIETRFNSALKFIAQYYPHHLNNFVNDFHQETTWLIEELSKIETKTNNILLLGSRYGNIVRFLVDNIQGIESIDCVDMDRDALNISTFLFGAAGKYKNVIISHIENDINFMSFDAFSPDIVINKNCDRMFPMSEIKFDNNPLYVLQSSNMISERENVNCVNNAAELAQQANIEHIYMKGFNDMVSEQLIDFKKFMVIGKMA